MGADSGGVRQIEGRAVSDEQALVLADDDPQRLAEGLAEDALQETPDDDNTPEEPTKRLKRKHIQLRSARRRNAILALTLQGYATKEIAEIMHTTPGAIRETLYLMRKQGEVSDTNDRMDHALVPEAMEQLYQLVAAGDKEAILAVLKGRGTLKVHQASPTAGAVAVQTNLVVRFEVPAGGERPVLQGQVVGVAREPE